MMHRLPSQGPGRRAFLSLLLTLLLPLSLGTGCSGGGGGGGSGPPIDGGGGATVTLGTTTVDATERIGSEGGTLSGSAGSPIEGVTVEVPAGALDQATTLSLGYTNGSVTPVLGTFGGVILTLTAGGTDQFYQPAKVTLPFRGSGIPVPYYIDRDGRLNLMDLAGLDTAGGTFSFWTFHASAFTYLFEDPAGANPDPRIGVFDSGFRPNPNGFRIVNSGGQFNAGGECTGFVSFSQWYFKHIGRSPALYSRYTSVVANGRTGQDIIVTRAYTSVNLLWESYKPMVLSELLLSDLGVYTVVRNAIANTGQPVWMHLQTGLFDAANLGRIDRHSVLAYATDNGKILVYDPNYPGDAARAIKIDNSTFGDFEPYESIASGYTWIYYVGDGSLYVNEPYNSIWQDAEANFHGNNQAQVAVRSHTNGQSVTDRNPVFSGDIRSGDVLIDKLRLIVNGSSITTDVPLSGAFSSVIPLKTGDNFIEFETLGLVNERGRVAVPNDQTGRFKLVGAFPLAAILVTLTWDKTDTDVDLYVTDPSGSTSWYSGKTTPDGGELDVDNTWGYGPEHWTLTTGDTVRYGQNYQVRLHYYADRDHGATNYIVTILLNEGTSKESTKTYSGSLSESDSGNAAPGSSGPDWADIAAVSPSQP